MNITEALNSGMERDLKGETYTWCLHCECVFLTDSWRGNGWNCPDSTCDGGALDAWPWSKFRADDRRAAPAQPPEGMEWPLYPENA